MLTISVGFRIKAGANASRVALRKNIKRKNKTKPPQNNYLR